MDSVSLLVTVAIVAWAGQIGLGFFQVRAFNRMIQSMSMKGKVKIGRTQSRWKARTIVALVEREDGVILDASVLKGVSVFARPKRLPELIDLSFPFEQEILTGFNHGIQEALQVAFQNE
jgi:glucitol operon activator protein